METIPLPATPFTYADLADLGISRATLRPLVDAGRVRRLLRGVYVRADVDQGTETRARATALVVDGHHVVCDRTAAWIHGVDALLAEELVVVPPIEVCTMPGRHPTERAEVEGHERALEPADVMSVEGLRLTTPLRTALDLGCRLRRREAYAALNDLARRHGVTQDRLTAVVARRFRGRRGVRQIRALIPLLEPTVESPRESWTLLAIVDAGLPVPEPQVWVTVDGVPTYRLDFAYRHCRVAIEYDGFDAHERTEAQLRYDEERRAWLRANGWRVIVIRRGSFTGAALGRWLDELAEALQPTYTNLRW